MIIVYHNNNQAIKQRFANDALKDTGTGISVMDFLFEAAQDYPDEVLVWCHIDLENSLNADQINNLISRKNELISYNPGENFYINRNIGYVDESPFVNAKKNICYPTWLMSGAVGAAHADVFNNIRGHVSLSDQFDYCLNSIAKIFMPSGLLCYSEPRLLAVGRVIKWPPSGNDELFRFVRQHYKKRWIFLLLMNICIYEKKLPIMSFLKSLLYKTKVRNKISFDSSEIDSETKKPENHGIDVIIPTIGRKSHLYDILSDFSIQTKMPRKIIIVEQNPDKNSHSDLDFLENKTWPFEIKHIFIHQSGACNARNIALKYTESDLVFFADDDIRIESGFIQQVLDTIIAANAKAVSVSCLQKGETSPYDQICQWGSFGSGCSFVFRESLQGLSFNPGYEFGFGEDSDFGMQLRNSGCDILYLPKPEILHLKAAVGGFRVKTPLAWQSDKIQPKPSPTIMLNMLLHFTEQQRKSYKTTLFFKYYRLQKTKNPWSYYKMFQKQWNRSVFWADKLKKNPRIESV